MKKIKSRDLQLNNIEKLFEGKIKEIYENYDDSKLEILLASLEVVEQKFQKIHELNSEVESSIDDAELEKFSEEAMEKEIELKTRIKRLRNFIDSKNENSSKKTEITTKTVSAKSNVKLPKLEIAKFSGEYIKWQTFKDSFDVAVHSCKSLSNVEKFNYLRGYLEEDALHCISGLALTNENYLEALRLLTERYGNTQNIITAHVNELLEITPITSNADTEGIRQFYDKIETHIRSLQGLGKEGKDYGSVLAPVLMSRSPKNSG